MLPSGGSMGADGTVGSTEPRHPDRLVVVVSNSYLDIKIATRDS
jgi:hypothetical protein